MRKDDIRHIIFDLDGVVYRGHTPIPGAAGAIAKVRKEGIRVSFMTNNATRSRSEIAKRLKNMGIDAKKEEIMSSAYATAHYLQKNFARKKVYAIGEKGLRNELRAAGVCLLGQELPGEKTSATTFSRLSRAEKKKYADVLVSGLDRNVSYSKLIAALDVLNSGAKWVACNLDPTLPMENGFHPGSGSIAAALAYASGVIADEKNEGARMSAIRMREPDIVIGKPSQHMIDLLLGKGKAGRKGVLFVGDRLDMDIKFANMAGLKSMLVLSGVSSAKDAKMARGRLKPDYVLPSIASLPSWL